MPCSDYRGRAPASSARDELFQKCVDRVHPVGSDQVARCLGRRVARRGRSCSAMAQAPSIRRSRATVSSRVSNALSWTGQAEIPFPGSSQSRPDDWGNGLMCDATSSRCPRGPTDANPKKPHGCAYAVSTSAANRRCPSRQTCASQRRPSEERAPEVAWKCSATRPPEARRVPFRWCGPSRDVPARCRAGPGGLRFRIVSRWTPRCRATRDFGASAMLFSLPHGAPV